MVKDLDKLIGEKLSDAISMVDDSLIISIGSASAFFFIGTKRDYENKIDKISISFVDYNKGLMDKYKSLIENAIEILIRHESTTRERVEAIGKLKNIIVHIKSAKIISIHIRLFRIAKLKTLTGKSIKKTASASL